MNLSISLVSTVSLIALLSACGGTASSEAQISQALELDDGGFDMWDEPPSFGELRYDFPIWSDTATIAGVEPARPMSGTLTRGPVSHDIVGRVVRVADERGHFSAYVMEDGRRASALFGIFGTRRDGTQVAFAKQVDVETGRAQAVYAGAHDGSTMSLYEEDMNLVVTIVANID